MATKSLTINRTKKRKLTNKEKKENQEMRDYLRAEGILPPVKPKLNRTKFAQEVIEEWEEHGNGFYLQRALQCFVPTDKFKTKITPEQIGALKVMKIAIEYKKFEEEVKARGDTNYTAGEFYEKVIAPIQKL